MSLIEEDIPILDDSVPTDIANLLGDAAMQIQTFQDRWDRRPIEQFVASDFVLVYHAIEHLNSADRTTGKRFCEWGCGFGVVSCLADRLGWDSIGIEAEHDLIREARRFSEKHNSSVELWHGNILPSGAERLSNDETLPSLGHDEPSVYEDNGLFIDDFDLIFAYPWPGEGQFLERVFEQYAAPGACFLTFCGPYDLRLVRKTSG